MGFIFCIVSHFPGRRVLRCVASFVVGPPSPSTIVKCCSLCPCTATLKFNSWGCHGLMWGGMDPGLLWASDGPCCCDTACRGLAMCYCCRCGVFLWSDHVVGVGTFRGVWCPTNTCGLAACPDLLVLRVAGFSWWRATAVNQVGHTQVGFTVRDAARLWECTSMPPLV